MDILEIVKNAFIFPSKNLEILSIFAILSLLSGAFAADGIVTFIFGIVDVGNFILGVVYIVIAVILGLITQRISIQCVKSGIDLEEKMPDFNWFQSLGTGLSKVVITIFYFIIPALIVVVIGLFTNIFGNIMYFGQEFVSVAPNILTGTVAAKDAVFHAAFPLLISLAITISLAFIIFLVFSFFQVMGEARLAHTGSLKSALNVYRSAKDISSIGVGRVFLLSVVIFILFTVMEGILTFIFSHLLVLSILTIVITPYFTLFAQRALGLLYSDIV